MGSLSRTWTVRHIAIGLAVVLIAGLASAVEAGEEQVDPTQAADTLSVVKGDQTPANAALSVLLSQATPFEVPVERVLVSRDDEFADALASGSLQDGSPLLLVPPRGPVPADVNAELDRLRPREAIVLGGPAAIDPVVVEDLLARGIAVRRRSGGSRIETAVAIAENERAAATTAIMARAFGSPDDPTQGFADALAAGGLAARNGWPVLLTQTDQLPQATVEYLQRSAITDIQLMGGTAAISPDVEDQLITMGMTVDRIAGPSRFSTAIAAADKGGDTSAADADRVVLVDGTGENAWAGGFAAASHAAFFDAPVVLAADDDVPPETRAFLDGGAADAGEQEVVLTCVTRPFTCEQSRRALGLPAIPYLFLEPDSGTLREGGDVVTVTIDPAEAGDGALLEFEDTGRFGGGCFASTDPVPLDGGQAQLTLVDPIPQDSCETQLYVTVDGGIVAIGLAGYFPADLVPEDFAAVFAETFVVGDTVPEVAVGIDIDVACTSPDGAERNGGSRVLTVFSDTGIQINSRFTGIPVTRFDRCLAQATLPPDVVEPIWGVFSFLDTTFQDPLFEGVGATAEFDLSEIDRDIAGYNVLFGVQVSDPRPQPLPLPAQPIAQIYRLFTDVAVTCEDGTSIQPDDGGPLLVDVADGTACTAEATDDGDVIVAQSGREPVQAPQGTQVPFTVDSTLGPTMVWFIPTGQ